MKLQLFLLLVSVALLQLSQTCSGQSGEDPTGIQPDTTGGIDYDMDDMFTTTIKTESPPTGATTEEPNLCIGSGSGSGMGSGDLMGSGCPSTTDPSSCPVQFIENCTIPDPLPSKPTLTDVDLARRRGICYAACANEYLGSTLPEGDQLSIPGNPLWMLVTKSFILSDDGLTIDCLEGDDSNYNGCRDVFVGCNRFNRAYRRRSDCRQNPDTGCGGIVFGGSCFSLIVPPCGLACNRQTCQTGCQLADDIVTLPGEYPEEANPLLPPNVQLVTGSSERFVISITESVPTSTRRLGFSTLVVKVEDLSQPCVTVEPVYFVLDEGYEINLSAFSCRTVNISYAVATEGNDMSTFSLPVTVDVREGDANSFPGQLGAFNFTVFPDPDIFQNHIIELEWELPERPERIDSYVISLKPVNDRCGQLETIITDPSATSYTIQNTEPYDRNNPIPALTQCSYKTEITVRPVGPDSMNPAMQTIHTNTYPIPTNNDITLSCSREVNSRTGDSYDLSINVELSDNFTSAVRTAVSFFHVTLVSINSLGPVHVFELTDDRLLINNTLFQSERTFFDQRALGDDEQYKLSVDALFNFNTVPIPPSLFADCILRDVGPILPGNVTSIQYRLIGEPEESYESGIRSVFVTVNITWEAPVLQEAGITFYDVRLEREPRAIGDFSPANETRRQQAEDGLSLEEEFVYFDVPTGSLTLYLQVRAGIGENNPGFWSEPIKVNVTVCNLPQPALVDFKVPTFSYTIYPTSNLLLVALSIAFVAPETTPGDSIEYHLRVGLRELSPNDLEGNFITLSQTNQNVLQKVQESVPVELPNFDLGFNAHVQMRAQVEYAGTNKSRTGNWSMSKTLPILIVPPPARIHAISAHLLGGVFFNYQKHLLSVLVMWVPSNLRTIRQSLQRKVKVTGYRVAVGLAPIEGPFGEVPLDTKVSNFRSNAYFGRIHNFFTVDSSVNLRSLQIYLQIQTVTDYAGTSGAWSEAIKVPVTVYRI